MRTVTAGLVLAAGIAWPFNAHAQLTPPPPLPPGAAPAQPAWGPPPGQPMAPLPANNATEQQLNAADASGSFRGLEVAWANVEAGGGYASLPGKLGYGTTGEGGAMFGVGAGARFVSWTLGVRGRVMPTSSFTLIQAMAEVGYHLPAGAWDPYVHLRGGYVAALVKSSVATAPRIADAPGDLELVYTIPNAHGPDVGISVGDDCYLSALFSVGLDLSFDTTFLSHGNLADSSLTLPNSSASAIGIVATASLHAGLHFDL